jgi:hypothetical protein
MNMSEIVKAQLKRMLNDEQKRVIKRFVSFLYRNNLCKLGLLFGSDKVDSHHYTKHYQHHFGLLRRKKT